MKRIPPSEKIRYQINELLTQGLDGEEDVTTVIFRLGVERLVQEMLEQEVTRMIAADVLETYQALYPSAMKSFQDDWEACIAYLRCPRVHHKRIRTTNLLERSFLDERHRTKVIPRFFTEKSCLKPPSALLPISRSLRTPMKSPRSSGDAVHLSEQCDASVSIIPSSGRHGQGSFPNRFPKSLPSVRSILWPCWKVC